MKNRRSKNSQLRSHQLQLRIRTNETGFSSVRIFGWKFFEVLLRFVVENRSGTTYDMRSTKYANRWGGSRRCDWFYSDELLAVASGMLN